MDIHRAWSVDGKDMTGKFDSNMQRTDMKNFKAISFDCGGTLFYKVKEDYVVFHEILTELACNVDVNQVKVAFEEAGSWWSREKARTGRVWNEDAWAGMLERMVSNIKIPNQSDVAVKLRNLWLQKAEFRAYDDVEPTIMALKERGIRIIAISNVSSKKNCETYLSKAGLAGYFDVLVASGSVGYEKPDPQIFKIASKMSNTPLTKMLHVGNQFVEDYLGAESAGMKAILLDRKGVQRDKNCRKISTLTELLFLA